MEDAEAILLTVAFAYLVWYIIDRWWDAGDDDPPDAFGF